MNFGERLGVEFAPAQACMCARVPVSAKAICDIPLIVKYLYYFLPVIASRYYCTATLYLPRVTV